jgi:hypothetical protein
MMLLINNVKNTLDIHFKKYKDKENYNTKKKKKIY